MEGVIPPRAGGSRRYRGIINVFFQAIGFIIRDDLASNYVKRRLL
jgi:hypothetical protein